MAVEVEAVQEAVVLVAVESVGVGWVAEEVEEVEMGEETAGAGLALGGSDLEAGVG